VLTLSERLKSAREEAGLSQDVAARRSGLTQPSFSAVERGEVQATSFVAEIAATLGVEALWLSCGRGPRKRDDTMQVVSHGIAENVITLAQKLVLLPDEKIRAISILLGIKL